MNSNLGLRMSPAQATHSNPAQAVPSKMNEEQPLVNRKFVLRVNIGDHMT